MKLNDLIDAVKSRDESAVEIILAKLIEEDRKAIAASGELSRWLDEELKEYGWPLEWNCIFPLVKAGIVSPASSDGVLRSMVYEFRTMHYYDNDEPTIAEVLLSHPELLKGVYRLFDVKTSAFDVFAGQNADVGYIWANTIIELCDKEHLDRSQILANSARGLHNPFAPQTIARIAWLHDNLKPAVKERKSLEAEYLSLLVSSFTSVIGFALGHLKAIVKAKQLNADAFILAMPRIVQCPAKGHVKTAFSILKSAVDQQPGLRSASILAAAGGLGHPHEDVQDAAMQLIKRWAETGDFQLAEILASHRDQVAAPIRPQIDATLAKIDTTCENKSQPITTITVTEESADIDWESKLQSRKEAIDLLPEKIEQLLALKDTWESCRQNRLDSLKTWKPLDIPVLGSLEPIVPIQSMDELFDAVEHAIETIEQGDELERIVDGISRLCDQRPDHFERRAKPLLKRIEKLSARWANASRGLLTPMCDRGTVRLLMAWLTGSPKIAELNSGLINHYGNTWREMLVHRLGELFGRVGKRIAAPLLATPTHHGGWIDPMVWADRCQSLEDLNIEPPKIDLIQSLLRLATERRRDVLECVKKLKTPYGEAMVWALGGEANCSTAKMIPEVWLAASRCRDSEISLVGEEWAAQLPPGPDVLQSSTYRWAACQGTPRLGDGEWVCTKGEGVPFIEFKFDPPIDPIEVQLFIRGIQIADKSKPSMWNYLLALLLKKFNLREGYNIESELAAEMKEWIVQEVARFKRELPPPDPLLLTAISHKTGGNASAKWLNPLGASVWPAKLDGYWASAVKNFVYNLEEKSSSAYSSLLEPLYEQDLPVGELAVLALTIASQCKNADISTTALDAWVTLIADGRGDARLMGQVLGRLSGVDWLKLNRLTAVLREVSRVSPLHTWTIAEMLQDLVAAYSELPADAHHVLQLLRELLVELGLGIRPELRPKLEPCTGSGKTAKLARQLSALANTDNPAQHAALLQLLDAQIQRADRWSRV